MSELPSLTGSIVLDTGLLVEFFTDGALAEFVDKQILTRKEIQTIYIHDYIATEVYYVICRQKGPEEAEKVVKQLEEITNTVPTKQLRFLAGKIKCHRAISLSDCFTCSIAQQYQIPALFKKEKELVKEKERKEFEFQLYLVEKKTD